MLEDSKSDGHLFCFDGISTDLFCLLRIRSNQKIARKKVTKLSTGNICLDK